MTVVKVLTDDGVVVDQRHFPDDWTLGAVKQQAVGEGFGNLGGWLGRAIRDARIIQAGGDPERPSEKVMRMLTEKGEW